VPLVSILLVAGSIPGPVRGASEDAVTGTVLVASLQLTLELSSSTVATGESVLARARVTNLGGASLRGIVVTLRLDPDGLLVKRPASKKVPQLAPGKTSIVSWSLCGRRPGILVILAQATVGGVTVESPARVLTITAGHRTC
jgi:hypothetical protein